VKIGITGHRFLNEIDKVSQGIDRALDRIEAAFGRPEAILSMLAEGADQLAVRLARTKWNDIDLIVPLPLSLDDYLKDYPDESTRSSFLQLLSTAKDLLPPPTSTAHDEAYKLAGLKLVDLCDVLIAVWDGEMAQGQGGTGEIVQAARRSGKPIAWVHAGNRLPGTDQATSLGDEQGSLTLENFLSKP
jgi:hypothetical protein